MSPARSGRHSTAYTRLRPSSAASSHQARARRLCPGSLLPPAWFGRNEPRLPVIELLHGTPGGSSDWTRASYADATALAFAEQHHGVAPILVMPDINGSFSPDSECVDSALYGQVETYLTKTVPQFMQKNFNAAPGSMAIAGLSEGGLCATTLALNNPREYPVFANYSGDESPTYQYVSTQQTIQTLFGGSQANYDAHNPAYLLTQQHYAGLSGCTRAAAVAALLPLARYGSPARGAALFGAATAVVWSVDAAFVKQAVDVLRTAARWACSRVGRSTP